MKKVVQHACDPTATINSILNFANELHHESIVSNPSAANTYFSALLPSSTLSPSSSSSSRSNNNIPLLTQAGIVGLLLVPSKEIEEEGVREMKTMTPDLCHLYLVAFSSHVNCVLDMWNSGKLDSKCFDDLMKAIRTCASICAEYKRSLISSSGILCALSKLASNYDPSQRINRSFKSIQDGTSTSASTSASASAKDPTSLQPTKNILTQAHVEFLQCCILASQYNTAKQFIDSNPIYSVPPLPSSATSTTSKNLLSSESFLRYFYLSGMVHLGCDDYMHAIHSFETCMSLQCKNNIVSAITIEARKKMLIAKCMMLFYLDEDEYIHCSSQTDFSQGSNNMKNSSEGGGNQTSTSVSSGSKSKVSKDEQIVDIIMRNPINTSFSVANYIMKTKNTRSSSDNDAPFTLYEKLVKDFVSIDVTQFTKTMNRGQQTWTRDGNMGLVKQLLPLIQYRLLRKISKIYEAIPMSKLATKLGFGNDDEGLSDTESYLLKIALEQKNCMSLDSNITHRPKIDFSIDSESSVVYFYEIGYDYDDDNANDGAECHLVQADLQKRVMVAMDLAERISKMDIALASSTKYQSCLANSKGCPEVSTKSAYAATFISDMM